MASTQGQAAPVAAPPSAPPVIMFDGPADAATTLVLAHGAGAPMDSDFMHAIASGLAKRGLRVARFEFPYMHARRVGRQPGPDRMPVLRACFRAVIDELGDPSRLVLGGKSMGGRVASLIADEVGARGLVCLGYPFHPPGKLDQLRTAHLATLRTRALIVQGSRDPFGTREQIGAYDLSAAIRVQFIEDGDHSFAPRKRSGRTEGQALADAVEAVAAFVAELDAPSPERVA